MEIAVKFILLILGLIMIPWGISFLKKNRFLMSHGTCVPGKIIGYDHQTDSLRVIVEYSLKSGELKTFYSGFHKSIFTPYKIGEDVDVLIENSGKKEVAEIANTFYLYFQPILLLTSGIVLTIAVIVIHFLEIF